MFLRMKSLVRSRLAQQTFPKRKKKTSVLHFVGKNRQNGIERKLMDAQKNRQHLIKKKKMKKLRIL